MKILLSAYACEPGRGSEPGFGWNWASHLAKAGHEVWVVTEPRGRRALQRSLRDAPIDGLHVVYVEVPRSAAAVSWGQPGVFIRYVAWQHAAYRMAQHLDRAHDFDVVHHVTWGAVQAGSPMWKLGTPFVFGPVGGGQVAPSAFRAYFDDAWWGEAVRSFVIEHVAPWIPSTRRTLQNADLVLATNRDTAAFARQAGAPRVELFLDSGLPAHYFSDVEPLSLNGRAGLRVLWVGRLYPRKAVRLSLDALARTRVPATLTILGDGPEHDALPGWIDERGLSSRVDWRGHVSWTEVQEAYQSHDVFLFNSLRESFGSQLLEAMANGLPIVTLDLHGAADFVPDVAGIKVPATTPDATAVGLARALDALHDHPEWRSRMSEMGRHWAAAREWSVKAVQMEQLYAGLIAAREATARAAVHTAVPAPSHALDVSS